MYDLYISTTPLKEAIKAQDIVLKKIANQGACVIVGRAADYVLKDFEVVKIFIYANKDYRINKVMEMYGDTKQNAIKSINKSDKARANYYQTISGNTWGKPENYDLCIDSSIGPNKTVQVIIDYVKNVDR